MTTFSVHIHLWNDVISVFSSTYGCSSTVPKNPLNEFQVCIPNIKQNFIQDPVIPKSKSFGYIKNLCKECLNQEILIIHKDGILVCTKCGFILKTGMFEDEENTNCHQPLCTTKQKRNYTVDYQKRRNHFKFWLQRLQGKEQNKLTKEDVHSIHIFIQERGLTQVTWDYVTMKKVLKMMGKEQWYNHIYYILKTVCNEPLVEFTSFHEDILLDMFLTIQSPFSECRDRRINMLNYAYLLRKFTEIQGWTYLSDQIPYVKSHIKLYNLDCIWKKICHKVGFPFIKSIH